MTGTPDEDAIQLDLYLDHVLAGPAATAISPSLTALNADLADTVRLVARGAIRLHPSFRFEERLGARLRDEARGPDATTTGGGVLVPFAPGVPGEPERTRHLAGVLVGGAIASGVSIASLAGAAAVVVWRRARWERLV